MCFLAIAVRESIRLLSDELGGRELSLPQVSALMMLASIAKPSAPTMPFFMQLSTVVSNTCRRMSASRNRPWRAFEKVE